MRGSLAYLFCAYFVVPSTIAMLFLRAGAAEIGHAYLIWSCLLLILGTVMGRTWDERLGWPMILGIFFTTPAIPAMIILLRPTGLRLPLFHF